MLLHCASLVAADKISVTETTHALLGRAKVEGIAIIRPTTLFPISHELFIADVPLYHLSHLSHKELI